MKRPKNLFACHCRAIAALALLALCSTTHASPREMLPPGLEESVNDHSDPAITRTRQRLPAPTRPLAPQAMPEGQAAPEIPAVGDRLDYDFFPDARYTVTVTGVTAIYGGAWLLEGVCEGVAARCSAVLDAGGERHEIHDFQHGKLYQAIKSPSGATTVREYDDALRPATVPTTPLLCDGPSPKGILALPDGAMPLGGESVTTNDLMICIDLKALQWINANGGGVNAFAGAAVAKMNNALQNSNVGCVIRLVHVYQMAMEITNSLAQVLADLKSGVAPFVAIPYFRNQTGADLVTAFVDTGSAYGTVGMATTPATLAGSDTAAFSVCAVQAVNNSQVMAHEIGHNLGAGHSKYQADEPGPSITADYAAGWYLAGTNSLDYHTIMAYNFDGTNRYYPCDYYSTPQVEWQGALAGDAAHGDNARVMRILKTCVANYKSRKENVTVIFNPKGGTVSPTSGTYTVGAPYGPLPVPERQGYTFMYWSSDYGMVTEESIVSPLFTTLYARWEETLPPRPYTFVNGIIYKYNGFETDVVVPGTIDNTAVTAITDSAFRGNAAVQTVTLPPGVTTIGQSVFSDMENLREVFLPAGLTAIGNLAFYGCGKMTNITFYAGVRNIPSKMAFKCSALATVTLPPNLTNIADNAFYACTGLRRVDIPSGCQQIGDYAFMNCAALTNCVMRPGLTTIGAQAFDNCAQLRFADLPDTVTGIGAFAFYQCAALARIAIPASLTRLDIYAFHGCTAAAGALSLPASLTNIGSGALTGLSGITAINVAAGNPVYASVDGVLFNKNKTLLIQCPGGRSGAFAIPAGVVEIGSAAFLSCQQITAVTIPDSARLIGAEAFKYCSSLTWIAIPATVTNLAYKAFGCCARLTDIGFVGDRPSFGDFAFESSPKVRVLVRPGSSGWGETQSGRPVVEWWPEFLAEQGLSASAAGFSFTVANAMGQDVAVTAATNLANGVWAPVANGQRQHNGAQMVFTDPAAAAYPRRFYRIGWPQ